MYALTAFLFQMLLTQFHFTITNIYFNMDSHSLQSTQNFMDIQRQSNDLWMNMM